MATIPSHRRADKKEQMFKFDMRMNGRKITSDAQLKRKFERMEKQAEDSLMKHVEDSLKKAA